MADDIALFVEEDDFEVSSLSDDDFEIYLGANSDVIVNVIGALAGVPSGGTTGQFLRKTSNNSFALEWDSFYTTGVFTPEFTFVTPGDLTVTYTTQEGKYAVIGDLVYIRATLVFSTNAYTTASGNARVMGLPFTSAVGDWPLALGSMDRVTLPAGTAGVVASVGGGATWARLYAVLSDAFSTRLTHAHIPPSKVNVRIEVGGVYMKQ